MDEGLNVRVHFVSGNTLDFSIDGFCAGQFIKWCGKCLTEGNKLASAIVSDDMYVNVEQIEYIEAVK